MSRETFVYRNGKIVPKSQAAPRTSGAYVISDSLPDMRHPITGKPMDSKSNFRAVTRAHGCVEVGNEQQRDTRRIDLPPMKQSIAQAIQELGG